MECKCAVADSYKAEAELKYWDDVNRLAFALVRDTDQWRECQKQAQIVIREIHKGGPVVPWGRDGVVPKMGK